MEGESTKETCQFREFGPSSLVGYFDGASYKGVCRCESFVALEPRDFYQFSWFTGEGSNNRA